MRPTLSYLLEVNSRIRSWSLSASSAVLLVIAMAASFSTQAQVLDNNAWSSHSPSIDISNRKGNFAVVFNNELWMMGGGRGGGGSFQALNEVFVTSNGQDWSSFTNVWDEGLSRSACFVFNGHVYVVAGRLNDGGGSRFSSEIWWANSPGQWKKVNATVPWTARNGMRAAVLNGKVYLMGGSDKVTGRRNDVYSSADGITWTAEANAAWDPRDGFGCAVLNGRIYVGGGETDDGNKLDCWSWDGVDGNPWQQESSLPNGGGGVPSGGVNGLEFVSGFGKIWAIYGRIGDDTRNVVNEFDGSSWSNVTPPRPSTETFNSRFQFSAVVWKPISQNRLWILPGQNGAGTPINDVRSVLIRDDGTPPDVSLNGSTSLQLECGDTFSDPGSTAFDTFDGTVTPVVNDDGFDANSPGTYTFRYTATDEAGNSSEVTRQVTVSDTTDPVLTLNGDSTINIDFPDDFTDPGATATDACDGSLAVNVDGTVNDQVPGTYVLTYTATDSSGNSAQRTRTVNIIDDGAPTISPVGAQNLVIECGDSFSDPGAMATDDADGDLTDDIVATCNVDTGSTGNYTCTYTVSDSSGNSAQATRNVTVSDTMPPSISLNGASSITLDVGSSFMDPGASASDSCDGSLTSAIATTGTVDTSRAGSYTITYSVEDGAGNGTSTQRTVEIVDDESPVVTLLGNAVVVVECGGSFADPGATAQDPQDGDVTNSITSSGVVDTSETGEYIITYTARDGAGNSASAQRTVRVRDTIPPVVSLRGSSTVTITEGDSYIDQGATATDTCNGALSNQIVTDNPVNPSQPATYTVVYTVSDQSGNVGRAERAVIVDEAPCVSPPAPSNVQASDGSFPDRVRISWTKEGDADRYDIYRNTSNSFSGATRIGGTTQQAFDDTTAMSPQLPGGMGCSCAEPQNVIYYYFVVAFDDECQSVSSLSDSGYRGGEAFGVKWLLKWLDPEYYLSEDVEDPSVAEPHVQEASMAPISGDTLVVLCLFGMLALAARRYRRVS